MKLKYYHNLDGVRGIAALMVVIFHFFYSPIAENSTNIEFYKKLTEYGQHGVSLFFVLSGFVITRILINTKNENNYFSNFYWKRILRIFPLYYLYLFCIYIVVPFIKDYSVRPFGDYWPTLLYLQNIVSYFHIKTSSPGHFWSLAVEEHYYLLWPFIIYVISNRKIGKLIIVGVILVQIIKYIMLIYNQPIEYFTFTRIDQIMIGSYLAFLEYQEFFSRKKAVVIMLIVLIVIFPLSIYVYTYSGDFYFIKQMFKYPLMAIFFGSLLSILILLNPLSLINKILTSNILLYLGKISYGIYVWHMAAIEFIGHYKTNLVYIDLVLTTGLSIIIAHLSYNYFELYFLKLKNKKPSIRKLFWKNASPEN